MGTTFEIASQSRAVQMLFPVPVLVAAILNRQSPTSGDIDVVIFRSAMVENVGVAFAIMSVCCWKLKLHRPAENLRFFQRCARPWFSRSLQVLERAAFTPEFLNSHRWKKYLKNVHICNPPLPLFAGEGQIITYAWNTCDIANIFAVVL